MRSSLRTSLVGLGLALVACAQPGGSDGAGAESGASSGAVAPTVLCQHVRDVAAKDRDDAEALDAIQRECVAVMTKLEPRYLNFTKCVDQAQTAAEISRCEQAMVAPPPLLGGASSGGGGGELGAVCDHMLAILQRELAEAGAMSASELAQLREQCVEKASKEVELQGEEAFANKAACILAAQSLADVEGCDPKRP